VVQAYTKSGLSVSAFCHQRGISSSLLYRWRRRCQTEAAPEVNDGFVELRASGGSIPGSGVTVVTEGGWRLELEPGFDAATLERALVCTRRSVTCSP